MWYAFTIILYYKYIAIYKKFYKFKVHFILHQVCRYLFVVDVQGLYCTMFKENNLQFDLKMVYHIFKTKENALLISNIECTWPSAKIANSVLLTLKISKSKELSIIFKIIFKWKGFQDMSFRGHNQQQ